MYRITAPKCLALGVAIIFLLPSNQSYSQEHSFQSVNFPDRFMRHRNFLLFIEPTTDELSAKDSVFVVIPGLAGQCHSFIPKNIAGGPTGFFVRHQNFRVKLSREAPDDKPFRQDATFCFRNPPFGDRQARENAFAFESLNFPNHFIRHRDFELLVTQNDGSDQFKKDATFISVGPRRPPVRIDEGTNLNPVRE